VESSSGIGSNSDSFYEYLLKSYLLFRKVELYQMFTDTYSAIKKFVQTGDWFSDVDMFNGKLRRNRVENLQAFWPGMESMLGFSDNSAKLLNSFYSVWTDLGFLPEEFDYVQWQNGKGPINSLYPLRPELIESTYHQYRSTKDRSWLSAGEIILNSIEDNTRTDCGYASVSKLSPLELTDDMPSFFLSETCKYLYLLFDEDNFVHNRAYIFSTEAHLFDPMQLPKVNRTSDVFPPLIPIVKNIADDNKKRKRIISDTPHTVGNIVDNIESNELLPNKCYKKLYWDIPSSFKINYGDYKLNSELTRAELIEQKKIKDELINESSNANAAKIANILKYTSFDTDSITNPIDDNLHSIYDDEANYNDKKPLKNRKHNACYPEDEPSQTSNSKEHTSNPSQTINVNMGPLGEFVVTVYADGFVVESKSFGDTIEISNIGQSVAFVRDVNTISTKTIIGDISNEIVTSCSVSIVTPNPNKDINPSSFSSSSIKLWERSCSVANFGPKVIQPIEGELLLYEQDEQLCTPIIKDTSYDNDLNTKKSWWQHLSILDLKSPTNKNKVKLSNDIVLAKRGGCMFEDKAIIAQNSGAAAVIVSNTDDYLFLMSGKKNVEELINSKDSLLKSSINDDLKNKIKSSIKDNLNTFNAKKDKEEEEEDIEDNIKIPTVMITKSDRENLISTIEEIKLKNKSKLKIKIELSSLPMVLDSEFLGNNMYPKLKMQKNIIHVVGRGKWGAILTLTTGSEYQLFIMSKKDMNNAPFDAITSNNNPISINGLNSANPVESYNNYLTNKCSTDFSFDGSIMKIKPYDEIISEKINSQNHLS
jgi:hypothetical protein